MCPPTFWILTALEGLLTEFLLILQPSEQRNVVIFGLSRNKLLLCGVVLVLTVVCFILAARSKKTDTSGLVGPIVPFLLYLLVIGYLFLAPPAEQTALQASLLERFYPLLIWGVLFCFQGLVIFRTAFGKERKDAADRTAKGVLFGLAFILLAVGLIIIAIKTGFGMETISGTFYRQGVSLLEGHLVIPILVMYPVLLLAAFLGKAKPAKSNPLMAIIASLIIWGAAFFIWKGTAFTGNSYFVPALRLPNENFYPSSDAENYDLLAQSILIGNGFRSGMTVVRPLYAAFLSLLHAIAGNDYMRVTELQIAVLALLPLCVYWIGRLLQRSGAGWLAAFWVIFREAYSISVTGQVQVSNSRLLMSDMPTALCTAMIILFGILWYRSGKKKLWAFICGGMIGVSMLIRTQSFVLLGALFILFLCGNKPRTFFTCVLLSLSAVCLVYAPWVLYDRGHLTAVQNPDTSESAYLVKLYYQAAYGKPMQGLPVETLGQLISGHPKEISEAIACHFINNEISSLLVLPERETAIRSLEQTVFDDTIFWYRESNRDVLLKNPVLTVLYIVIIGFGISSAVNKLGAGGIFPLLVHLSYNAGCALALNSGFRFILPVDWVLLIYFGVGCCTILRYFFLLFAGKIDSYSLPEKLPASCKAGKGEWTLAVFAALLFGLILPLCDTVIPYRFPENENETSADVTLVGRAIYPRYYPAGEGDSGGSSSVKREGENGRMVWMFLDRGIEVLSYECSPEEAKAYIPDPLDVVVSGVRHDDYIEVEQMQIWDGEALR